MPLFTRKTLHALNKETEEIVIFRQFCQKPKIIQSNNSAGISVRQETKVGKCVLMDYTYYPNVSFSVFA
jgi:hypothetical protein